MSCTLCSPYSDTAYNYQSACILSLEPAFPATQAVALDALPTALSDPIICDFGQLCQLDTVLAAQAYSLFALFRILLGGGLDDLYTRHHPHEHHRGIRVHIWPTAVSAVEKHLAGVLDVVAFDLCYIEVLTLAPAANRSGIHVVGWRVRVDFKRAQGSAAVLDFDGGSVLSRPLPMHMPR
ncbi:hypothetical protein EDB84DRAFT_1582008 [Lactarius hengduanensis]|nr:hypothetical protein EDB84DRAFT_1582008 [Lactarius hengduanensis]